MIIHIQIGADDIVHSTLTCEGESFPRAVTCIEKAIEELQLQLANRNKCPASQESYHAKL